MLYNLVQLLYNSCTGQDAVQGVQTEGARLSSARRSNAKTIAHGGSAAPSPDGDEHTLKLRDEARKPALSRLA